MEEVTLILASSENRVISYWQRQQEGRSPFSEDRREAFAYRFADGKKLKLEPFVGLAFPP